MRNALPSIGAAVALSALTACSPAESTSKNFTCLEAVACANVTRMSLREAVNKIGVDKPSHQVCNVTLDGRTIGHVGLGNFAIPTAEDPIRGHCGASISSTFSHAPVILVSERKDPPCKNERSAFQQAEDELRSAPQNNPEARSDLLELLMQARDRLGMCLGVYKKLPTPQAAGHEA